MPLFEQYRVFHKMKSDMDAATLFLNERICRNESAIFAAYMDGNAIGFTQIYLTFSSVSLESSLILNDLFVAAPYRNKKVGKNLLLSAQEFCKNNEYKGLALETATDNAAQLLYKRLGWAEDSHCFHYFWASN